MLETIVRYLVQGVDQKEIASIVGCSEGYVSQVKERKDYDLLVEEAKRSIKITEQQAVRVIKYEDLEDKILAKLTDDLPFAEYSEVMKLMEILHRRKAPAGGGANITINNNTQNNDNRIQSVVLQLPQAAVPEIRLNTQNEVIGIGSDSLAPMSATNVKGLFAQLTMKKEQRERERLKELEEERKKNEVERQKQKEKIITLEDLDDA